MQEETQVSEQDTEALQNYQAAQLRHERSYLLHSMGEHALALRRYQAALDINPQDTCALYGLGNVFYFFREYALALQRYQAIIDIDPRHTYALHGSGHAFYRLGRHAEARQSFLAGLAINEDRPSVAKRDFQEITGISYEAYKGEKEVLHAHLSKAICTLGIFSNSEQKNMLDLVLSYADPLEGDTESKRSLPNLPDLPKKNTCCVVL
jgi:tetratricopeptide (TPR) repeat protein